MTLEKHKCTNTKNKWKNITIKVEKSWVVVFILLQNTTIMLKIASRNVFHLSKDL